MINTKIKYVAVLLLTLDLCGCGGDENMINNNSLDEGIVNTESEIDIMAEDEQEYPKIAYIDDVSYYGTDEICEMVPRKSPDGIIETFVPAEVMPDAYNSANFGSEQEQLEYMFFDDDQLIIHIGEEWYYFEQRVDTLE